MNTANTAAFESAADQVRTKAKEVTKLVAEAENLLGRLSEVDGADIAKLRVRIQEKLEDARSAVSAGGRRLAGSVRATATQTDEYVRESPWQSIGVAALVGIAVGFVLTRR